MRPMLWPTAAALFFACSPPSGDRSDPHATDTASATGTDDGSDGGTGASDGSGSLNGTPPEEPIPLPTFAATNRDGSARTRDDLLGHPTVMWFYPLAASAG